MAYKTVIRLDLKCSKCKKVALHSVTKIEGIESVTINIHESTLTIIGDADPVCMIKLLKKKICCVHLVCYGPCTTQPPPPPDPPKPDPPKTETSATATATSTSISTPTFILYNSPCNCRPPPTCYGPCSLPDRAKDPDPPKTPDPHKTKTETKTNPPKTKTETKTETTSTSTSASTSTSSHTPTSILYNSPCNCLPPPTFPCTPPNNCPPTCKPPKCCPPHLSCSCGLEKCCPTSCPCPNKSEIMWPQYHNPLAPDDVWYVWKEDQQESCTIM